VTGNRTVQLPILGVKKNPQQPLYTQLGVLTKGTIIEVCFFEAMQLLLHQMLTVYFFRSMFRTLAS
jgi:ribosomal protein S8E